MIAIENVRLFQELEARTRELARSVGELKALGEVGQAVSSTLDLQTVLSAIVGHAVQLSGTSGGVIYEYDEAAQEFHLRAAYQIEKEVVEALQTTPVRPGQGATGQTATVRAPVQVPDILEEREYTGTRVRPMLARLGYRSVLAVPLLREERIMGALDRVAQGGGQFFCGSRQLAADLCDSIRPGDSKRAAVSRDRGKEPADRDGQPPQVGVSRQHVARAAHAAQRHYRFL